MTRWMIGTAALLALPPFAAMAACEPDPPREQLARLVAFPTVAGRGQARPMADYLAAQLRCAGFDAADIEILPVGDTVAMQVRYRAAPGATKAPVVLLAHMDVVDATPADWTSDPWTLTEDAGLLRGRGVVDNKYGVLAITHAFITLRREGFVPDRELVAAFTGDEESTMASAQLLAGRLRGAAFAINADAGGGHVPAGGGPGAYYLQAAEKTYATFELEVRNRGGHSSEPRADNAIVQLSVALQKLAAHRFPVRWNEATLSAFAALAPSLGGETGEALAAFLRQPGDPAAVAVLEREPGLDKDLRSTCVPTLVRAGESENALPTRAVATLNCRLFPGHAAAEVRAELERVVADPGVAVRIAGDVVESPYSPVPPDLEAALREVLAVRAPGAALTPYQEAGATDGLYFRHAGIPTVGAGPLINRTGADFNYHGVDEQLPVAMFEEGLDHFERLLRALAGPR